MVELVQRRGGRFHPTFLPGRPPGSSHPLKCTLVRVCWDKKKTKQTQDRCWSGEALWWRCRACVSWIFNIVTHSHGEQCRQIEWFGAAEVSRSAPELLYHEQRSKTQRKSKRRFVTFLAFRRVWLSRDKGRIRRRIYTPYCIHAANCIG